MGGVAIVSIVATVIVLWLTIVPSFDHLEQDAAADDIARVLARFETEKTALVNATADWGVWDETYNYLGGTNDSYADNNFYLEAWQNLNVDLAYFVRADGTVAFLAAFGDVAIGEEVALDIAPADAVPLDHPLMVAVRDSEPIAGVMHTNVGSLLVAAHPVLHNDGSGPPAGFLAFGRILNDTRLAQFENDIGVAFTIAPYTDETWSRAIGGDAAAHAHDIDLPVHIEKEPIGEVIHAHALIMDPNAAPVLFVESASPRDFSRLGGDMLKASITAMLVVSLLTLIAMSVGVNRLVVMPLQQLANSMRNIAETDNLALRTDFRRADELGAVSRTFDQMLADLQTTRLQLAEDSFMNGVAETASGVMHNVRNQIQPVLLALGQSAADLENRAKSNLKKAVGELGDDAIDEDRKRKLLDYVDVAIDELLAGDQKLADRLRDISGQVMQVDDILSQQNSAAYSERVVGRSTVAEAMGVARNVVVSNPDQIAILLADAIGELPPVKVDPTILSQLFGNLLLNAERAIHLADVAKGEIEITGAVTMEGDAPMVHIVVRDNGIGMDKETREKIFERGFTTKRSGNGGFGLHWCATGLAAADGRIWVESDGVGKGATFHIQIPQSEQSVLEPAE